MARRKKKKGNEAIELNMAAMLDMAFQLLTFFILTFKPMPVEGQVSLRLPPPQPMATVKDGQKAGEDVNNLNPVQGINSLVISVFPTASGHLGTMSIGESPVGTTNALERRLKEVLSDKSSPFDQVLIQVGPSLRYEELMRVIDVCTRQTLPSGQKLTKLSFVELPQNKGN